jgi:hypothetical protein
MMFVAGEKAKELQYLWEHHLQLIAVLFSLKNKNHISKSYIVLTSLAKTQ